MKNKTYKTKQSIKQAGRNPCYFYLKIFQITVGFLLCCVIIESSKERKHDVEVGKEEVENFLDFLKEILG